MTWKRWAVIVVGLATYWSLVGREIAVARVTDDPKNFGWFDAIFLTMPWGLLPFLGGDPPRESERAWMTAITAAGAMLNGLLFASFVLWVSRRRHPRTQPARDYEDGPHGAIQERAP